MAVVSSPSTASRAYAPSSSMISSWVMSSHPHFESGVGEPFAQTLQPGTDPALHGALRLIQRDRDLAIRHAPEVRELDGLALLRGQRSQRVAHLVGDGKIPHLVLEVVAGFGPASVLALL